MRHARHPLSETKSKSIKGQPKLKGDSRKILELLGIVIFHVTPEEAGEAETNRAPLQKSSVVDALLSENVDTLDLECILLPRN